MTSRRILIDIDVLFDTRLGIIANKHPEYIRRIEPEAYYNRVSEVIFDTIGIANWREEYWVNRTVDDLKQSHPTEFMVNELDRILLDEIDSITLGSPTEVPKLTINHYPYKLTKEEYHAFAYSLKELFPKFEITLGSWCSKHLTTTTLRKLWDCWFTYDLRSWLEIQAPNLGNRIPKFVIYSAAILHDDVTEEVAELVKRDQINPFTEASKFLAEYVTLTPLDVGLFSIAREVDYFTPQE